MVVRVIDILYGSVQIVSTYKVEGDRVFLGGYSIHRDQYGAEVSRTPNEWNLTMTNVPDYCLPLLGGERII